MTSSPCSSFTPCAFIAARCGPRATTAAKLGGRPLQGAREMAADRAGAEDAVA